MTLTEKEQEYILQEVYKHFDKDEVKSMDDLNIAFIKELEGCDSILDFLSKLKQKYPDNHNMLIAGILFGINLSEQGYNAQTKSLPSFGHAQ